MSDLSNAEQEFASIIIEIIEQKYKNYMYEHKEKGQKLVPLENIKIELQVLKTDYVNFMQGFAPGEEPEKTAKRMLSKFCYYKEIERYSGGIYNLNKNGVLYKHLAGKLQ